MLLVRDVMRAPITVHAEETLQIAALRLKHENIGAMPVVEDDRVVGMITDRDILLRGVAEGRTFEDTSARQAMSVGSVQCHEDDTLGQVLMVMSHNHVQRLPVMDRNEKLVGMLSLNELTPSASKPAPFEVVFYKKLPNSSGHIHHVELTRVAASSGQSRDDAVSAAIREFEKQRNVTSWNLLADGYDVQQCSESSSRMDRIRQRAYTLWERQGRTEGLSEEHWAQACKEIDEEDCG